MRRISEQFMADLTAGLLSPLRGLACTDQDITLEIRENYVNLYFKGYSVAKSLRTKSSRQEDNQRKHWRRLDKRTAV